MGHWKSLAVLPGLLLAASAVHAEDRATVEDLSGGAAPKAPLNTAPITPGPFEPTYESLKAYRCPQWYQDAKFGMWAHWGPQGVAEIGDWYARDMYVQDSGTYNYHVKHYGHPSKFGYKDIIPLFKAEHFDPDHLISLYKAAGAHYFVSMGCHHDNFDMWNSKYHRWNAVNMGPHKDIVGLWKAAAVKQGLRFGVSEHMAPSFKWFSVAHGSDKTGPLAGVPYDGNDPANYDLYGPKPEKIWSAGAELWQESNMPDSWKEEWYARCRDLLDNYQPDYVYSDYGNVPFRREVGWKLLANYYNKSIADHHGKLEAVYTGKGDKERVYVRDFESGAAGDVQPEPWQMDWCINSFFYVRDLKARPYRTAPTVLRLLMDVVSKNGNLLLSIPQRPDGTIDDQEEKILADMAGWMKVNGEAIFGSRPFKVYGEGNTVVTNFRKLELPYTARDIRFTVQGDTLYATCLGVPGREVTIQSLGAGNTLAAGAIGDVTLLGYAGKLTWKQTAGGLVISIPEDAALSPIASVFKLTGLRGLAWDGLLYAGAGGAFHLGVASGTTHLPIASSEKVAHVGGWTDPADTITWKVNVRRPGTYRVNVLAGTVQPTAFEVRAGPGTVTGDFPATGSWETFQDVTVGQVTVPAAGAMTVELKPADGKTWRPANVAAVTLTLVEK